MLKVLYITSSSYSGSTLLSLLLNTHPEIFTVGEMDGWNYGHDEIFRCSCGVPLSLCPFYQKIEKSFLANGLPFDFRNFGTAYRLTDNERFNRYLTGSLPTVVANSFFEKLRDRAVSFVPPYSKRLLLQDKANLVFISTALEHSNATIFVDACKDPYRLRHLRRIPQLELQIIYLVRDFRGVALSNQEAKGWEPAFSVKMWIDQQCSIFRILKEFPSVHQVYYEKLCHSPNKTLAAIHRFVNLPFHSFGGDFKEVEHHVLGNTMRLSKVSRIVKSERWKQEFSASQLSRFNKTTERFLTNNKRHRVSEIIAHYLYEA